MSSLKVPGKGLGTDCISSHIMPEQSAWQKTFCFKEKCFNTYWNYFQTNQILGLFEKMPENCPKNGQNGQTCLKEFPEGVNCLKMASFLLFVLFTFGPSEKVDIFNVRDIFLCCRLLRHDVLHFHFCIFLQMQKWKMQSVPSPLLKSHKIVTL